MTPSFKQLSISEREEIAILYNKRRYSLREIALALSRNVSTISREIKKNSVRNKQTGLLEYIATKAHHKKYVRRKSCKITLKKIKSHPELETYIRNKILAFDWSPETVSEIWSIDHPESELSISWKTIYQYCYSAWWQSLCPHLYQQRYHPKRRKKRERDVNGNIIDAKKDLIPERVWIEERPEVIEKRWRIGDTESDFIVSVKWNPACLETNVDRKSRYLQAILLPDRTCKFANSALSRMLNFYNTNATKVHSTTLDNDFAFQHHTSIRDTMNIQIYFCHPYHSWEKWQVEYANRLLRRYIPKKSRLADYSQNEIDRILEKINNTPRKCLGWKTPIQVLREEGVAIGGTI